MAQGFNFDPSQQIQNTLGAFRGTGLTPTSIPVAAPYYKWLMGQLGGSQIAAPQTFGRVSATPVGPAAEIPREAPAIPVGPGKEVAGPGELASLMSYYNQLPINQFKFSDIDRGPIWNQQQIAQQVALAQAQQTAGTGGLIQRMAQEAAGRGFSSRSPQLAEQQTNALQRALASNVALGTTFPFEAAGQNAAHVLAAQQAQAQVENARAQAALSGLSIAGSTRGQDISRELGFRGQDIQQNLGLRSQDIQQALGFREQDIGQRGQDISRQLGLRGQDVQQALGFGQQAVEQRGQDVNAALGYRGQDVQMRNALLSALGNSVTNVGVKTAPFRVPTYSYATVPAGFGGAVARVRNQGWGYMT